MRLSDCHPNRKHMARGMCKNCYDKWLKEHNPKYKDRQQSNTTKWCKANPEKYDLIKKRRKAKEARDPNHKIKKRNYGLKKKYGITVDDYDKMLVKQGGGCKICSRKPGKTKHHVDHCHSTGKVRGILCHQCNWYLGTLDSDPKLLWKLNAYYSFQGDNDENNYKVF